MPQRVGMTTPLRWVWVWAGAAGAYGGLALLKSYPPFEYVPDIPSGLDAALAAAMALLIAFRVNRAYERWWEARTLWGSLVNVSRNLAVKTRELQRPEADDRQTMRDLIVAYCHGLKDHLREDADLTQLPGFEDARAVIGQLPDHVPSFIVGKIYNLLHQWNAVGRLSDQQLWVLDVEARMLLDICGGCERIKTTLMPVSWRHFTRQCIVIYLLVLPWGLVDNFGWWTMPLTAVVAYFVIAAELIAHYVEEPFGLHEDHLALESICQNIDRSVSEILLDKN